MSASVHAGIYPPRADTHPGPGRPPGPGRHPPDLADTPPNQADTPPCSFTLACAFYCSSLGDCTSGLVAGSGDSEQQAKGKPSKWGRGNAQMAGCLCVAWCSK